MNGSAPVAGTRLVTPNERELFATMNSQATRPGLRAVAEAARDAARRWHVHAVAVTLGPRGALLAQGYEPPFVVPAMPVRMGDTCGAGDCFAGAAAAALGRGALVSEAVERAVACATSFVAAGGARVHRPTAARPQATIEPANASRAIDVTTAVRARGGVVVATGGCFDLLHTGHIATLERARRLGDCLIVLVNSDESVRRLKGPGRPLRPARERAAVLQALGCVDAVEIFDADTPSDALERLRPDVFAKGGDYTLDNLPEAHVLARWGGQAVVLPYVPGRSTTALVEKARTPLAQPNSPVH